MSTAVELCGRPIFQLMLEGETIKIYANGFVEGWPETWPRLQGISNHLPLLLSAEQLARFSKQPETIGKTSPD